ncbi:MAG: hypothetical protein DCF25_22410 [Leptolyngbya foveolarum]|uniref:Uncharacterized protein n=1 Tax=Leptolyngbya foveolarum TaxID=47253 RepID=A0A2W4TTL1_9CYAN|nr:MAG: hypothetical protein DCF25_22410 [Leptolyngbya foveolarum]
MLTKTTSDFIVDTLQSWWATLTSQTRQQMKSLQIKVDNGPENSGVRTQFLKRMVDWVDHIGKPVRLLYYPALSQQVQPYRALLGHS